MTKLFEFLFLQKILIQADAIDEMHIIDVVQRFFLTFFVVLEDISQVRLTKSIKPTNHLTMKNFTRIILLVALVFVASKVLFSDLETTETENKLTAIVNK